MEVVKMLVLTLFLVAKALSDNRRDKMSIEWNVSVSHKYKI
jgi:hypothetical protein